MNYADTKNIYENSHNEVGILWKKSRSCCFVNRTNSIGAWSAEHALLAIDVEKTKRAAVSFEDRRRGNFVSSYVG